MTGFDEWWALIGAEISNGGAMRMVAESAWAEAERLKDAGISNSQRDAERYRFLRDGESSVFIGHNLGSGISRWTGEHADKLVDERIASSAAALEAPK